MQALHLWMVWVTHLFNFLCIFEILSPSVFSPADVMLVFVFAPPLDFKKQKMEEVADVMTEIHHSFILQNAASIRSILITAAPKQVFISHLVYS